MSIFPRGFATIDTCGDIRARRTSGCNGLALSELTRLTRGRILRDVRKLRIGWSGGNGSREPAGRGSHKVMSIGKTGQILLADIGGTNARFALSESASDSGDQAGPIDYVKVADFPTVREAIADVLARRSGGEQPKRAVLAVAGPVTNNRCVMTNSPWVIDGNELQPALGFDSVHVLNDFEVVAWSLPALQPADLIPLGGQDGLPESRCWWLGLEPALASPVWSNATAPGWRSSPRQATRPCRRRPSARSA